MPLTFPISQWFEDAGSATAQFNADMRDAVTGFACELWQSFPDFMTKGSDPITSFARGVYNTGCLPVQSPVNPPRDTFTGGQCENTFYRIVITWFDAQGSIVLAFEKSVWGPIKRIDYYDFKQIGFGLPPQYSYQLVIDAFNQDGTRFYEDLENFISGEPVEPPQFEVFRVDGNPDDCGDPPKLYPINEPTPEDLTKNVEIENPDGEVHNYEITFAPVTNNYNFPAGFTVNGVNVTIDMGGVHFHGSPEVNSPTQQNDGNNPPPVNINPPGTGGSRDSEGNPVLKPFPEQDFPVLKDFPDAGTIVRNIQTVVCTDGVLEVISNVINIVAKDIPWLNLILGMLIDIIGEICDLTEAEGIVGFPEWYGLSPGQERPAIVYLWKELVDDVWGRSTYSSTVQNPTDQAIDDIDTIDSFSKTMGTFVASLTLTDGSRMKASGFSESTAISNLNFLIGQVKPEFLPSDITLKTRIIENKQIQTKTVRLRQIEYYPTGAAAGKSPVKRRILDP